VPALAALCLPVLALQVAPAAAAPPTYDLNGAWTAAAIGCNGTSEALGTLDISGWNPLTGAFYANIEGRSGARKSGSGEESATTVMLTILSVPGAKGLLPGRVFSSGSALTINLSIDCSNGASGSYTLVNRSPETVPPPARPIIIAPPSAMAISEQEHDLSSTCSRARQDLLTGATHSAFGLSLAVAAAGTLEATVFSGPSPGQVRTPPAPGGFQCEGSFRVGSASTALAGPAGASPITVASLTRTFPSPGEAKLQIPLTAAGRALLKKLAAADRRYHSRHPHGHRAPGVRFTVRLHYTPGA
jgi:hypothetical protein